MVRYNVRMRMCFKRVILVWMLLVLLIACTKRHARILAGMYACKVTYQYWDMRPTYIDTVYYQDLEIKRNGKYLIILNTSIHVDSLWNENIYQVGSPSSFLKVQFKGDSVFIYTSNGGMGGRSTFQYSGKQK